MPSKSDNRRSSQKSTLGKIDDVGTNVDLERQIRGASLTLTGTALASKSINDLRSLQGARADEA